MVEHVDKIADAETGDDAAGISEKACQTVCCGGGAVGSLIGGGDADEGLGAVDEEAGHCE